MDVYLWNQYFTAYKNTKICGCQENFQRADPYVFALLFSSSKQVFIQSGSPCGDRHQNIKRFIAIIFLIKIMLLIQHALAGGIKSHIKAGGQRL